MRCISCGALRALLLQFMIILLSDKKQNNEHCKPEVYSRQSAAAGQHGCHHAWWQAGQRKKAGKVKKPAGQRKKAAGQMSKKLPGERKTQADRSVASWRPRSLQPSPVHDARGIANCILHQRSYAQLPRAAVPWHIGLMLNNQRTSLPPIMPPTYNLTS